MSTNDLLESMVGLIENAPMEFVQEETECEEISYDDIGGAYLSERRKSSYEGEEEINQESHEEVQTTKRRTTRKWGELQALQFRNPGDKTSQLMPTNSDIVNRSRGRRAVVDQKDENLRHDKTGRLTYTLKGQRMTHDLCDCLNPTCTGCQWPCRNCKSRKCLVGCRQNRKEMVGRVEGMYTVMGNEEHNVAENPYFQHPIKNT